MAKSTELLMILHDERDEVENKDEEIAGIETLGAKQEAEPTPVEEDDTPEKYRGKSSSDLIRMHQEAEKHMGRQSQEVGSLRKEFDTYVQAQLATTAEEPEEEVDFFSDPQAAMKRAIDNHPDLVQARKTTASNTRAEALANLKAQHSDMDTILADAAFGDWVMESPVRKKLYAQADQQFDYDSANELLSNWKERRTAVEQTNRAEKNGRKQALKSASTGTAQGSGEASSKKVYRRSDIIKLMQSDPERYQSLSSEIMQAYAEGRVR
tara:strand:- start:1062 stop:1862 length:801 start_codon:yes stop_codon:yes gene_type:complete